MILWNENGQKLVLVAEAAQELGICTSLVRLLCHRREIEGAMKFNHAWYIPSPVVRLNSSPAHLDGQKLVLVAEAAQELGICIGVVQVLCRRGEIEGAIKFSNVWYIPSPVVRLNSSPAHLDGQKLVLVAEAAQELGICTSLVKVLCRRGEIEGARKFSNVWYIPSPVVRLYQSPAHLDGQKLVLVAEAAQELGICIGVVQSLCRREEIEGAIKFNNVWYLPSPVVRLNSSPAHFNRDGRKVPV